jgi:type III pantothenate kinase
VQLAVDIGNTRIKGGVFEGRELIFNDVSQKEAVYAIKDWVEAYPSINGIIISSVRKGLDPELIPIPETIHHIMLDDETELPIRLDYKTPETLGHDRIALAAGAWTRFPNKNSLVIDLGTCITMEVVSSEGIYLGGRISPGMKMRFDAMHKGTDGLPLISPDSKWPDEMGKSTEESMKAGVIHGILNEINDAIKGFSEEFNEIEVLITGGDSKLFENQFKSHIFADPNLVLHGLNSILLYNIA